MSTNKVNNTLYTESQNNTFNLSANIIVKIIITVVLIAVLVISVAKYNKILAYNTALNNTYLQVKSNVEKKADLVPRLLKLIQSHTKSESKLLRNIAKLRTKKSKNIQDISQLNKALKLSTLQLYAIIEKYPILNSSQEYKNLFQQIQELDNRINIVRMQYNAAVKEFNSLIELFPDNYIASFAGMSQRKYFQADKDELQALQLHI
ncbi:LemA family protein [Sulfurimonas sp.]